MELQDRRIVVTGASSGIGRAIAVDLCEQGATVYGVARREAALRELAGDHPGFRPLPADLLEPADRARVVREAGAEGPVDALVNNAGTAWIGPLADMAEDDVERTVALNLTAVVALTQGFLPGMLARGRGHVVTIGSITAFTPAPPLTVYAATKAAVHAYTEGLRREVAGTGVRVSLVAPGPVDGTEALGHGDGDGDSDGGQALLRRVFDVFGIEPEEVAVAVRRVLVEPDRPGTREVTVPHVAAVSKLAQLPSVRWGLDTGFGLLRRMGVPVGEEAG